MRDGVTVTPSVISWAHVTYELTINTHYQQLGYTAISTVCSLELYTHIFVVLCCAITVTA